MSHTIHGSQLTDAGQALGSFRHVSESDYHADPCPRPSLSSSIAKTLVDRSPLHAWQEHPRLGGVRRKPTDALDRGSLIHELVLGGGADVRVIHADDYRTKKAREERDAAREVGALPVLAGAYADAREAAEAIKRRIVDAGVVLGGDVEQTITWREETAHGDVWCRARLDHVTRDGVIHDLKSTRSAHPRDCARSVLSYGYDIQRAAYVRALAAARPELDGRIDFVFLFVETEPPYALQVARLDGALREYGDRRWARALNTWAKCISANEWPGYGPGDCYLEAPGWLLAAEDL